MTKEVISLSRIVKERDEKIYAEENKFVFLSFFLISSMIYFLLKKSNINQRKYII
jgi:hypothetical protein